MRTAALLLTGVVAIFAASAVANDGVMERAAGGLVFTPNDQVDMVSEDLYVSLDRIRVRYRFRNRTRQDVRLTVGFPLPEIDLFADMESDTAFPEEFRTLADGRPVPTAVENRAFLDGTEHTDLLNRLGVPIMIPDNAEGDPIGDALVALSRAEQDRLVALGLAEAFDPPGYPRRLLPRWTVRQTYHWDQVFPAGRDLVIEHSYRPGAGGTVLTGLTADVRGDGEAGSTLSEYARLYCVDRAFLRAVDRVSNGGRRQISESFLTYILTTGAGWRSPIGEFRLVVDKGRPESLVSFCGENVRRLDATRFEMRRRNWRPDRDLRVLVLHPYPID